MPALESSLWWLIGLCFFTLIGTLYELRRNDKQIQKERAEIKQRVYEILILREIGERIGYELNIEKILETIIVSLNKYVPFTAIAYLLVNSNQTRVSYRIHLDQTVSQDFIDIVRGHMLQSLNDITSRNFADNALEEHTSGMIIDNSAVVKPQSLWIAPLKINSRGIGVLALASTTPGLYKGPEMEILSQLLSQANRAVARLEELIANEQSKVLSMISAMSDGVIMLGVENNLIAINQVAKNILGFTPQTSVSILDIARALADKVDLRSKIDQAIKTNTMVSTENLIIGNRYLNLFISPALDKDNKLLGTVIVFSDVTAEKELARLREDFMAMIVHELRAPLTVIRGTADMFLTNPSVVTQPSGTELIETMRTSAGTMLTLVNDMLDAAKIDAGKFQIYKAMGDLSELIKDRVLFFQQLAAPKQITLIAETITGSLITDFDRERINQVFNNLISNAIKFTPLSGKVTVRAKVINTPAEIGWRFQQPADTADLVSRIHFPSIFVSIDDTGIGIPPDKITGLSSKFQQLSRNTEGYKGTGLGLVITKGIIESHGGVIFVESEINSGTTFHFTLPLT